MTTILRHPELNDNRWTKVVQGQGGALIDPATYEVKEGILCDDCQVAAPHLKVRGGEWLRSRSGELFRSAGLHIESDGRVVSLLVVAVESGGRRRLQGNAFNSLTPISTSEANDMLGQSSEIFNRNLQEYRRSALLLLERTEATIASYLALTEVQSARNLTATPEQPAAVPAPDVGTITVDIEAAPLEDFEQAILEGEGTPIAFSAAPATSSLEQPVSLRTLFSREGQGTVPAFRGTVRHRRW